MYTYFLRTFNVNGELFALGDNFVSILQESRCLSSYNRYMNRKIVFLSVGFVSASSWNLPGVDIVTRAQRGAEESMKYQSRAEYQEMIRIAEEREKYMTELEHAKAEEEAEKSRISREHALANFPNDILLDMVVDTENGNKLRRKQEYLFNKTKILVHHTVNDISKFSSEESVKSLLRSVYRMHAFSNGRGDI